MQTHTLIEHINQLLKIDQFLDYCPNGLQVEGKKHSKKIVTAVTASLNIIEKAIDYQADTLLVHHGFFWKNEPRIITNHRKKRLTALLKNDINLAAYHLPLDMHPSIGNNVMLAKKLDIEITHTPSSEKLPLLIGHFKQPTTLKVLADLIDKQLSRAPILIEAGTHPIKTIGICTGSGQGFIEAAKNKGVEAYLSGEISETTPHFARENNIHYIGAGHHATERYGIQALGQYLAKKFSLEVTFIDEHNPA